MRELIEFPGSVEGTTMLDETIRCALGRGFENNPGLVKELEEITDYRSMKFVKEVIANKDTHKFPPSDEVKMIYSQVAKRELERISESEDDSDIFCDHTIEDHLQALKDLLDKMEPTIN